jgi:hypothetical protein
LELQELTDAAERVCHKDFGNDFAEEKSGHRIGPLTV